MSENGWMSMAVDMGTYRVMHVLPIDDLRPHVLSTDCWCVPVDDATDISIYIHNSLDRREAYEEKAWH